jgi:membrane associated rhomboid family serine protease
MQLLAGLPQLSSLGKAAQGGVAVWAHIGGFFMGVLLIKFFENPTLTQHRTMLRHRHDRGTW